MKRIGHVEKQLPGYWKRFTIGHTMSGANYGLFFYNTMMVCLANDPECKVEKPKLSVVKRHLISIWHQRLNDYRPVWANAFQSKHENIARNKF